MTDNHFIADLPSFTRFADVADPAHFVPAPDGWRIYCCDIVNSTKAIAEGRYKGVNMMGAACIMAAINATPGIELAYVFGGDGATILAPDAVASAIDGALTRTRALARQSFGLAMRVGAVPLAEIRARGADMRVAMFELSPGNRLAMFTGGGAAMADRLIKSDAGANWLLLTPTINVPISRACPVGGNRWRRGAVTCCACWPRRRRPNRGLGRTLPTLDRGGRRYSRA